MTKGNAAREYDSSDEALKIADDVIERFGLAAAVPVAQDSSPFCLVSPANSLYIPHPFLTLISIAFT